MHRSSSTWLRRSFWGLAIPFAALSFARTAPAQSLATPPISAACNAEADALRLVNPDKKTFVDQCEQKGTAPAKRAPSEKQRAHQQKMKDCNAKAKTDALKGDERKAFMKQCLRSDKASPDQSTAK